MRDRPNDAHMKVVPAGRGMVRHHKNEQKDDNRPENLEVITRAEHTRKHNSTRGLSKLRAALRMVAEKKRLY